MKNLIYSITLLSLLTLSLAPAIAQEDVVPPLEEEILCAEGETLIEGFCHPPFPKIEVGTGLTESTPGGTPPEIMAKWEMNSGSQGEDDSWMFGAQFMPPGEWGVNKEIEICAIATDPDGRPGPGGEELVVYADVFYPNKPLGRCHETDVGGCELPFGYELELSNVLSKADGYQLFCQDIRHNNYFLPRKFNGYSYDDICDWDTGALMKETALVYCKHKSLKWEDPTGYYDVQVHAVDKAGAKSTFVENHFKYLPLTAFEVDFTNVQYGAVKLNTIKYINGDVTFSGPDSAYPTVRNVGNTRLTMKVKQDDMGLGKTENGTEEWNVMYDARVGSTASRTIYEPYEWAYLNNVLDLSCTDEMDFSIKITKFHGVEWGGTMWLGAVYAPFERCISPG